MNTTLKKLSLDKIKISKLNNTRSIVGGSITDLQVTNIISVQIEICATTNSIVNCGTNSTKTTPIGGEGS